MKFAILAAALAAATPAIAADSDTNNRGMLIAQPVRYEFVYEAALRACPLAYPKADPAEALGDMAQKLTLSRDETVLLFNYCLVWIDGRKSTR